MLLLLVLVLLLSWFLAKFYPSLLDCPFISLSGFVSACPSVALLIIGPGAQSRPGCWFPLDWAAAVAPKPCFTPLLRKQLSFPSTLEVPLPMAWIPFHMLCLTGPYLQCGPLNVKIYIFYGPFWSRAPWQGGKVKIETVKENFASQNCILPIIYWQ